MSVLTQMRKTQEQVQEEIPAELVKKFENKQIAEMVHKDYSVAEMQRMVIVHPTRSDPVALLDDEPAAMWL